MMSLGKRLNYGSVAKNEMRCFFLILFYSAFASWLNVVNIGWVGNGNY